MANEGQKAAVALERLRGLATTQEHLAAIDVLATYVEQGSSTELYAELVGSISTALGDQSAIVAGNTKAIEDACKAIAALSAKVDSQATPKRGALAEIVLSLPAWGRVAVVVVTLGLLGVMVAALIDGGFRSRGIESNAVENVGGVLDHVPVVGGPSGSQ